MSPNKSSTIIKCCIVTSSTAICLIFISLIPVSKKALYWNQCFKKTYQWIEKNDVKFKSWDKASKESIAVALCKGEVWEPKIKK